MGRRGPKPKGTVRQLAAGDPGKRAKRRLGVEPMPAGIGEAMPAGIGEPEVRRARDGGPEVVEIEQPPQPKRLKTPKNAKGEELLNEEGQAMWHALVEACHGAGAAVGHAWLTTVDVAALTSFCLSWGVLCSVAIEAQTNPTELSVTDAGLVRKVSPYLRAATAAMQTMKGMMAELGFSPAARARLTLGPKGEAAAAEFERFLGGA